MYKVIVVDDEALVREAICKKLDWGRIGYELAGRFENGVRAKEFLEQNPVDVVLTDICMPFMDGMQLSEYIYEHMPEVKVIIFSGFDEFEYAKKAIRFQVQEYLLKPVTAVELSELLLKLKQKMDYEREAKNKNAMLSRVVNKNIIYLRSRALHKLLSGSQPAAECRQELEENGVIIEGRQFLAAVLEMKEEGERSQSSLFQFILFNMVQEIIQKWRLGWVGLGDGADIFILFAVSHQRVREFRQEVQECLTEVLQVILKNTQIGIDTGVGRAVSELEEISISYQSASDCLKCTYSIGNGKILWAEEAEKRSKQEPEIRPEIEGILSAVRENQVEKIEELFETIRKKLSDSYAEKTKAIVYLQMCVKALFQFAEKCTELTGRLMLPEEERILLEVEQKKTLAEAVTVVRELAGWLAEKYEMETGGQQNRVVVMAMDYLCKNYGKPELTLTEICSHFGVSVSRFSANFKGRYDETFMEALSRIRMEKAKMLLSRTDLKNYEIAERVGFTDPHYFGIAFKKATGKTPTEWGKEHVET